MVPIFRPNFILPDSHPGKVFRECDHVYEQLFGYDSFDHGKIEVCKEFETTVMGKMEKGVHCACLGDNCNTGPVQLPPPWTVKKMERKFITE